MAEKEHIEQAERSDNSWNVTTSRMLIQFYKENRILWDKKHKDYGKKHLQKKALMPLIAKLERSNVPKGEDEIKKRWHNIRTSAQRYFKKYANDNSAEIKWAYWDDMTFLREHIAAEEEQEPGPWSTEETGDCSVIILYNLILIVNEHWAIVIILICSSLFRSPLFCMAPWKVLQFPLGNFQVLLSPSS